MTTPTADDSLYSYSYVVDRTDADTRKTLKLLQTTQTKNDDADDDDDGIVFEILTTSLSANNKFYVNFGDKAPFFFFKCYPVKDDKGINIIISSSNDDEKKTTSNYATLAHPPAWGICKVIKTNNEVDIPVGAHYFAQLPIGERVSFPSATVDKEDNGNITIHRPETNPAYNGFQKVDLDSPYLSKDYGGLALVCSAGIVTGFGLYHYLKRSNDYFGGSNTIVLTSASSKVSLALALLLKQNNNNNKTGGGGKTVIGYTSKSNVEFCKNTGLYDTILEYDGTDNNKLETEGQVIMVDVAGLGKVYKDNIATGNNVVKLISVGNSSDTPDDKSTFATFSYIATIKLILSMMGAPTWIRNWLTPVQELFLIWDIMGELKTEWGNEKLKETMKDFTNLFCQEATSKWNMTTRMCETEESIEKAYTEIMNGTVPPTEAVVLNMSKAVAHRK